MAVVYSEHDHACAFPFMCGHYLASTRKQNS